MHALAFVLGSLLLFSGVEYRNNTLFFPGFQATNMITAELEAKTGVRLRFIIDKNITMSVNYMEKTTGRLLDNDIVILLDTDKRKLYRFQGKNTEGLLENAFFSFVLENELLGPAPGLTGKKVESAAAILAKYISAKKGVSLLCLRNIYVKPVDSLFYRITEMWPFKPFVRAFYGNVLLFLSIFPAITWFIFVKLPETFSGEEAAATGKTAWKLFLFVIFCVIITRVSADFNALAGTIAAALVIFMPFVAIAAAVFKEEIRSFTIKFFGWED